MTNRPSTGLMGYRKNIDFCEEVSVSTDIVFTRKTSFLNIATVPGGYQKEVTWCGLA